MSYYYPVFSDGDKLFDSSTNVFGDLDTVITSSKSGATSDRVYQLTLSEGEYDVNISEGGIEEVY